MTATSGLEQIAGMSIPFTIALTDTPWQFLGQMGDVLALGLAAVGSALGIGMVGQAAAGAWAKETRAERNLSFTYIILLGMPTSQTFYALIAMNPIRDAINHTEATVANAGLLLGAGLAVGIGELFSAWMQGLIGAAGVRMLSEGQGKGFAFVLIAMGIAETIGIFTLVFVLPVIPAH